MKYLSQGHSKGAREEVDNIPIFLPLNFQAKGQNNGHQNIQDFLCSLDKLLPAIVAFVTELVWLLGVYLFYWYFGAKCFIPPQLYQQKKRTACPRFYFSVQQGILSVVSVLLAHFKHLPKFSGTIHLCKIKYLCQVFAEQSLKVEENLVLEIAVA